MEMGERIKKLRQEKGLTQEELGKYIGVKKAAIMKYEKGNVKNMKRSTIETLSKLFNVSPSFLMCLDEPRKDKFGNSVVSIPLLGEVRAGYNYLAQENWLGTVEIKQELAKTGDFFALQIKGDSMFETLWEGDIVAVKKQDFANDGNIAVVLINGDEATVKKIKILDNGIKLIPLNRRINPETQEPYYEDKIYTKEDIQTKPVEIIGIVKQIIERNL